MAYKILTTDEFDVDLDEILRYIAVKLSNPGAASSLADELEKYYGLLEAHPYLFEESRDPLLRQRGYRKFIVGNYIALYLVDDQQQTVTVARLFYGKRDYLNYI